MDVLGKAPIFRERDEENKKSSRNTLPAEDSLNPSSEEDEVSASDTSVNTATKEMKSG